MSHPAGDPVKRFWSNVVRSTDGECWPWSLSKFRTGYGAFGLTSKRILYAHRYAYEITKGPIPQGMVVDHVCHRRDCVNPAHLRVCTQRENILAPNATGGAARHARSNSCVLGHLFTPETTDTSKGYRLCLTCYPAGVRTRAIREARRQIRQARNRGGVAA